MLFCENCAPRKFGTIRYAALRAEFMALMSLYKQNLLIWVYETGSDLRDHASKYGYATRSQYPMYHHLL